MNIYIILGKIEDERVRKNSIKFNNEYVLAWELNYMKSLEAVRIFNYKNGYSEVHLLDISSNNNNGYLIDFLQTNNVPLASDIVDGHYWGFKVYVEIGRNNHNLATDVLWKYIVVEKAICKKEVEVKREIYKGREYFVVYFYKTDSEETINDYKEVAVLMYEMWRNKQ